MRTKKSSAQKALQDAFRTSFYQLQSAATASKDEPDSSMTAANDAQSTASSRSCSTCGDEDDAMLGRMSRLSLHNDDFGNLLYTYRIRCVLTSTIVLLYRRVRHAHRQLDAHEDAGCL